MFQLTSSNWLRLAVIFFALMAGLSFSHSMAMNMGEGDQSGVCPLMAGALLCRMNIVEHISMWQRTFTLLPEHLTGFFILMVSAIAAVFLRIWRRSVLDRSFSIPHKTYQNFVFSFSDPLQYAFSQGVLHPRIYQ